LEEEMSWEEEEIMIWLREGPYWETLSHHQKTAILKAVQQLIDVVTRPSVRGDWVDLAGTLRIVLDELWKEENQSLSSVKPEAKLKTN
jgi:hypothetical protein